MLFQTLNNIKKPVQRHFRTHPNSSIYSCFKKYRNQDQYSLVADYPLLSAITHAIAALSIKPNTHSIKRAFRSSMDLKGQKNVCDSLIESAMRSFYKANPDFKESKKLS